MQVDDKLAKEKLARELEALYPHRMVLSDRENAYRNGIVQSIKLIRNTDLTDCQQGKLLTRPAQVGGTVFAVGVREDMVVRRAERQYEYEHEKAKSDE